MWPTKTPEVKPPDPEVKPLEKSPAEVIAESLRPLQETLATLQTNMEARFKTIEDNTKKPEPKRNAEENQPISVLDDENVAFAQRLTPVYARTLEIESRLVKSDIVAEYEKAGYGDLLTKFKGQIDQVIDNSPLVTGEGKAYRGDPQYIRNVIDMVMGRAAREAGMRFDGKNKGFFLETGSSGAEGDKGPEADGMSEPQRKLASRMGVPLDKAKDVIKKLHFVA